MVKTSKVKAKKKKEGPPIAQAKMLRVLQIITLLKSDHWAIKELSERADISERTVYRYLDLLQAVDFIIEQDFQDKFFIVTSENESSGAQFTIEEMKVIKKLIQADTGLNPMKSSLLKKLSLNSQLDSVPRLFLKVRSGKLIEQLAGAISGRRQVVLKNYHSANSNEIRDRLVEPFQFGDNYQTVFALDVRDKVCKQFKLERIGEIIEMRDSFKFADLHKNDQADIFGFVGDAQLEVTLHLTMRAYLLLREDFPLSIPYTSKIDNGYQFHGPVSHFEGVGRFVLGLIDEVLVVKPETFRHYLEEKIKRRKPILSRV
jgi:proteasome accessory factor C